MNPIQIRSRLVAVGVTQAAIAAYLKVSPTSVGSVIAGKLRSRRIEEEIEKAIGAKAFQKSLRPGRPKVKWTGQPGVPA